MFNWMRRLRRDESGFAEALGFVCLFISICTGLVCLSNVVDNDTFVENTTDETPAVAEQVGVPEETNVAEVDVTKHARPNCIKMSDEEDKGI